MKNTGKMILAAGLLGVLTACGAADKVEGAANEMHTEHHASAMKTHPMKADERTAVHLTTGERLHVLEEMRGLLQSTQGIIEGLARDDMDLVQKSALAAGTGGRRTTENQAMHKKMPKEWMMLGMKAHKSMDEIAQMAADGKPAKEIQLKLVDAMNACTACHSAYQIPSP